MLQIKPAHLYMLVGLGLLIFLLDRLAHVLLPFALGFVLAYFLDPLADFLEVRGVRRALGTTFITFVAAVTLIGMMAYGLPVVVEQIAILVSAIPYYMNDLQQWLSSQPGMGDQTRIFTILEESALDELQGVARNLLLSSLSLINLFSVMIVTPIVTIYMLNDWDRMVTRINALLPHDHAKLIRHLAHEINVILGGFVRGQMLVCLSLGAIYAVGLGLVGLNGGIAVGFVAGLVSIVPYVGATFGLLLAVLLGLGQFGLDWPILVQLGVVFGFGQFIEGNILTPRLVGNRIHLHPVWIIFALLAMGGLFGFLGLLLAVPGAAVLGVLVRHLVGLYARDYVDRPSRGEAPD